MAEKYDIPEAEIKKAVEFAETEEYVDVYCFAYCITGGPMETTAFKTAGLEGMDKEAILARYRPLAIHVHWLHCANDRWLT